MVDGRQPDRELGIAGKVAERFGPGTRIPGDGKTDLRIVVTAVCSDTADFDPST